jgi:hypothetical protein
MTKQQQLAFDQIAYATYAGMPESRFRAILQEWGRWDPKSERLMEYWTRGRVLHTIIEARKGN